MTSPWRAPRKYSRGRVADHFTADAVDDDDAVRRLFEGAHQPMLHRLRARDVVFGFALDPFGRFGDPLGRRGGQGGAGCAQFAAPAHRDDHGDDQGRGRDHAHNDQKPYCHRPPRGWFETEARPPNCRGQNELGRWSHVRFRLVPRDEGFFPLFDRAAQNVAECARRLSDLLADLPNAADKRSSSVSAKASATSSPARSSAV